MSIFKAYDIRGIYGKDLTESVAEQIGRAFVTFLKAKKIVVGRDIRHHSVQLITALKKGMMTQGAEVIDLGLCSTPMNYFANGTLKADGSIMVTASHNPPEYNGFKLCRQNAIPISGATGIKDIEKIVNEAVFDPPCSGGKDSEYDIGPAYYDKIRSFCDLKHKPKVVMDFANAMGSVEIAGIKDLFEVIPLYEDLDGDFPHHEANPLQIETLNVLRQTVRDSDAQFGVSFDGDADRCGFVDENGEIITMDLTTALIAREILTRGPATILFDLRSSWVVREVIEAHGGTAIQCRVGHAFIKNQMRECGAVFAGELAGHYYFKENFTAESSALALIMVARVVEKIGKPLSEIIKPLRKYYSTGEINSKIEDPSGVLNQIKEKYADGRQFELDGISTEYEDWWFNVRKSNTEPLVRLILEAKNKELMEGKKEELLALIRR